MSGETDWMSLGEWVVALRDLHAQARRGSLPPEELKRYHEERETLAQAILAAQRLRAAPNAKGRRALRVARELAIELSVERMSLKTRTLDLGVGGFAVMMAPPPRVGQEATFSMEVEAGQAVSGKARVVSVQRKGKPFRVAFRFEELPREELDKLGLAIFDAALAGIVPGGR